MANYLITKHDIAPLYNLKQNAVLVEYGKHEQTASDGDVVRGKIYRCASGASVTELFNKISREGKSVILFNADGHTINQANV